MGKYFGTDGVRGVANVELTPQLAYSLGRAGAYVLNKHSKQSNERIKVIIGTDTRISKDILSCALAAGAMSIGADIVHVGVIPTPGVAYLTRKYGADAGVVISASHNPMQYNGIKFFNSRGLKLDDALELEIESYLDDMEQITQNASGEHIGKMISGEEWLHEYEDFLVQSIPEGLSGLRVTLDCAYGAAYQIAPRVFERLGAEVHTIHHEPNGTNINHNAGSTDTKMLQEAVRKNGSDLGLAYDGDADRLIAIDEQGCPVDGDQIMLICADALKKRGQLAKDTLVVTVMSNLGLHLASQKLGIVPEVTAVGDRYVLERMLAGGYVLGGEQSGHMIFMDYNTTGDGILSSLILAQIVRHEQRTLSSMAAIMDILPQVLINARVKNERKLEYQTDPQILEQIAQLEQKMEGRGRVLIRHSGTEPLVRVMLEGADQSEITEYAQSLVKFIEQRLGS